MIIKYVRNSKRIPSGVVVVMRDGENIHVGWSLHRKDDETPFTKDRALQIAVGRAQTGTKELMPFTVRRILRSSEFNTRCQKYFKQSMPF